jgi:16S rRNA (guanine527-N7)-methyltransferase
MLQRLVHDAAALGVALTEHDAARLRQLLEELAHWNRRVNLTGIVDLESMISHHVLDSLAVHRYLHGTCIADVGTGAGFPGLPLALVNPERRFSLIDSNGKKIRFVSHAVRTLGLMNVEPLQARAETCWRERSPRCRSCCRPWRRFAGARHGCSP